MSKIRIHKKDGTPSRYFWSDQDGSEPTRKTIYKKTESGVKRMRGAHYDSVEKRVHRHEA